MNAPEIYDVVIVGLGPSGAAAANACGQLGLRTLVVERDLAIFERQRAIALDDEALRAIDNLGLYDDVTAHMHLGVTARFIGLNGKPFIVGPTGPTRYTGHAVANFFHQPLLEHALREGLRRWPHVQVLAGWTAEFVEQDGQAVTLRVADADSTDRLVRARYVLACDGGSSPLRKQLGIEFAGKSYSEQWMDVQARTKRPLHRGPHFDFVCSPTRPGVRCPCPGGYYRWEWRINAGEDAESMLEPENVWRMLAEEGVTPDDVEIARTWSYTFHVRKAREWRRGRVLLLGDAAHVMPPFAGQGISGAFRDAANVVWKIHAAIAGHAGDDLLDTYQSEREPHHDAMTGRAVLLGRLVMPPSRSIARLRDIAFRVVAKVPGAADAITRKVVEPTPLGRGCLTTVPRKRSPVGYLLTPARVAMADAQQVGVDQALGLGWSILGMDVDPRATMTPQHLAAWQRIGARFLTIRPGTSVVIDGELGDPSGQLWNALTDNGARYLIVRPDRYVYQATDDAAALAPPTSYRPGLVAHATAEQTTA
ncbi:bifunctional 3-(3-hydroxy-phenyl)propionate/3-hydroxycinnamic acid hydroxylase [Mycobacterium sp. ITM-2016-00316]|uniref:bifunctional 3-(3-hydroxy-phenyl)propionate/3-hydroxycinnamic acid hydroxylase n=1 Tax=Mycobacterium sp. ITM-2016-00316 TaxID=2099695 RepID=UPI001304D5B7|nr:bifunctional 3-(3-hydroxy-phenyl)propionate/3-hydroxycinnamic acid hydroxylase [Mycobacterium sp. ITM-2016-00316]WNG83466.1 bifunctional 3-(3-hydroxy-phenyl)propionate/3-hydroxycinnamic acid hydroxylase [Mycobacterium sp. ITM-2016-00316]